MFYEPIPFEWLFTAETTPQVLVTVDDTLPAVCSSWSCGYTYQVATALITGFSLNGLTLTIDGSNLPTETDIVHIYHSNVLCSPTSVSTS